MHVEAVNGAADSTLSWISQHAMLNTVSTTVNENSLLLENRQGKKQQPGVFHTAM